MSQRLKSDVRRVERADSEQDREQNQCPEDDKVESRRKHHQRSETERQEKMHETDRNNERSYHRERVDHRKRQHRSDDGYVERHSRTNVGDVVKERSRRGRRENGDRPQHTDDRHLAHSAIERDDRKHNDDSDSERKNEEAEDEKYMKAKRAKVEDTLTTRTGGAYIPPARLKMMQVS